MRRFAMAVLILGAACLGLSYLEAIAADKGAEKGPMLAHNVFLSLVDNSEAAKRAAIEDSHKYLSPIRDIVFYAAGTPSEGERPVVDRDYDVALHFVFKNKAAMENYQVDPKHLEYVKKHKGNWKKVRVFDSLVRGAK